MVLALTSLVLAQSGAVLEPFKPAPLPETIKPNPIPKTMMDFPRGVSMGGSCLPSLKGLMIPTDVSNAKASLTVTKQLAALVAADQAPRTGKPDPDGANGDQIRREKALVLLAKAVTIEDFINIGLIFQHGNCVPHFRLANALAAFAMSLEKQKQIPSKTSRTANLFAVTLDRSLMFSGKAQKFGTQASSWMNQCNRVYVTDPRTTDAERAEFGVPPLKKLIADAKAAAEPNCK